MIPALDAHEDRASGKPRASGDDPYGKVVPKIVNNVNPARAGMILPRPGALKHSNRKPRASGDDPLHVLAAGPVPG